jgi:hypothetical protein
MFEDNIVIHPSGSTVINIRGLAGQIKDNKITVTNSAAADPGAGMIWWNDSTFDRDIEFHGNEIESLETNYSYDLFSSSYGTSPRLRFTMGTDNILTGLIDVETPSCQSYLRGQVWSVKSASGTKDELQVCERSAAGTYAWQKTTLPAGTSTQFLIHNGSAWTARTLDPNGDVEIGGAGYMLVIQPDSVTASMLDSTDTPADGECVTAMADGTFNFDACSGAAQPASNVSVTTTAFDGAFSDSTDFDTQQEINDFLDDNTATADKVYEGDSKVEVTDTGTGQIDFTVDGVNLARMTEIVGGTYHAFLSSQAAATRFSLGAASGVDNDKFPRIQFIPDDDVATAVRGTALFDYGSGTQDLLGSYSPYFEINVNNSTDSGSTVDTTKMFKLWKDQGALIVAKDVTNDIADAETQWPNSMCTLSQNEATNSLVIRCKESGGTINTFTIAAD